MENVENHLVISVLFISTIETKKFADKWMDILHYMDYIILKYIILSEVIQTQKNDYMLMLQILICESKT